MGFGGTQDNTFFICGIRDWLKNCRKIRDSNICGIRDKPQNHSRIRDSNISWEWDKVRDLFSISEMVNLYLLTREIEIAELNPQTERDSST